MRKIFLGVFVGAAILAVAGLALAGRPESVPEQAGVRIPDRAKEVAPGVFYLGRAMDKGRMVEGYAFVRYKKGFGKPGTECGNGVCEPSENKNNCSIDCGGDGGGEEDGAKCYDFLAKGARWRTTEPYTLDSDVDSQTSADSLEAWDQEVGFEIFGGESGSGVDGADTESPDGKNEVMYGDIEDEGVIAVTIVWGVFSGPPFNRELVEWDAVFDNVDYNWGDATVDSSLMDYQNIATHEFGHAAGMADLYEDGCMEQTMYGYASEGEIKKRTLEAGDINGILELYE